MFSRDVDISKGIIPPPILVPRTQSDKYPVFVHHSEGYLSAQAGKRVFKPRLLGRAANFSKASIVSLIRDLGESFIRGEAQETSK